MKKYDLAVIGGGFAGICSAISASRLGAKVIIIEKSNCLGGAATNALVIPFMRYWTHVDGERFYLSRGIFKEIHNRLIDDKIKKGLPHFNESFMEEDLKKILNDMAEEENVDLLFHAQIFKAEVNENKITSVSFATVQGEMKITADYFIDATGNALLSHLAGVPTVLGREPDHLCQPMTLCFRVANVDTEKFFENRKKFDDAYALLKEKNALLNERENVLVFKTPIPNVLHFNSTRVVKKNPTDAFEYTQAEILARKQVYELFDFIKNNADGLENAYISATAFETGIRESRMIIGDYVLTEKDCRNFKKFEDSICACNYDIDIHNPEGKGTSHYYFPEGEYYTIPYRALIPKNIDNMLVAGRCISSDHGAQASYRIMPTVANIGEGAGTAIGLAIKDKVFVRQVDIKKLQKTLKENGAFIGI